MILLSVITVFLYMSVWFIVGKLLRRNDVADVAWGLGFVVLAWALYINRPSVQLSLAVFLVTIWGVRLSTHIFMRNRNKPEDYRYQTWRKEWGKWFTVRSFFQVFMLQGILLICISAPLISMGKSGRDSISVVALVGLMGWVIGFIFESVGDYQLRQFLKDSSNKGKIVKSGLWRYSRHPNYFGEVLGWWSIWIIAYGTHNFWLAVLGPLTITILILKVSGVPLLEKRYQGDTEYEKYKKQTSMFVPLPIRRR